MASAEGAKAGLLAGAAFRPWLKHKLWITLQSTITHNNFIHHNSKEKAGNGCGKTEWSFETVRATFRRSLIALSWEAPCYSKPPPSFHLTDSSLRKTPFTVAFPQRAKIWLCCFLSSFFFFLESWGALLWERPNKPIFQRTFWNLFDYNHKGKDCEAPVLIPRETLTGQKACLTAKLSSNDRTFYFSQERVI